MKTILYVLANFPSLSETFIIGEIRAMRRRGHRIVVLVLGRSSTDRQPDCADIEALSTFLHQIQPATVLEQSVALAPGLGKAWRFVNDQKLLPRRSLLWCSLKIAAWARRQGADHVHAHFAQGSAAHAIVAARLLGVPVTFVAHGHDVYQYPQDLGPKLRAVDAALAVCEDLRQEMLRAAPAARILTVPCGVDPARFRPRSAADASEANGRLLFIGRLIDGKGLGDAIVALAGLAPEIRPKLDAIGTGPDQAEWEALAASLGLDETVTFLGSRSSEWIARHGPAYLGLVAPFKPGRDGFKDASPTVVKEAMAMGLPVVTTRFSGAADMIDESCGFTAEPGDPASLLAALDRLLRVGAAGRESIARAALERFHARYTDTAQAGVLSGLIEGLSPPVSSSSRSSSSSR